VSSTVFDQNHCAQVVVCSDERHTERSLDAVDRLLLTSHIILFLPFEILLHVIIILFLFKPIS
jgi:hypothetical protein